MSTKKITYSSVLIAIGVILPIIFHILPGSAGKVMLPIHYSAYFAGGVLGPAIGGIVGLLTPLVSFFITGMPPYPAVLFIAVETAVYGLVFGLLYYKNKINIVVSLIIAMVIGRIANIGASYLIGSLILNKGFTLAYIIDNMILGIMGVIYQLVIIPLVIKRLEDYLGKGN